MIKLSSQQFAEGEQDEKAMEAGERTEEGGEPLLENQDGKEATPLQREATAKKGGNGAGGGKLALFQFLEQKYGFHCNNFKTRWESA